MKTTVIIDDALLARLRREAAAQRRTMSELIEEGLRLLFNGDRKKPGRLPKLPRYPSGGLLVDISDRDALYDAMEDR